MKQKKKNRKRKHVAPTRKRRGHMDMKFAQRRAKTEVERHRLAADGVLERRVHLRTGSQFVVTVPSGQAEGAPSGRSLRTREAEDAAPRWR